MFIFRIEKAGPSRAGPQKVRFPQNWSKCTPLIWLLLKKFIFKLIFENSASFYRLQILVAKFFV